MNRHGQQRHRDGRAKPEQTIPPAGMRKGVHASERQKGSSYWSRKMAASAANMNNIEQELRHQRLQRFHRVLNDAARQPAPGPTGCWRARPPTIRPTNRNRSW